MYVYFIKSGPFVKVGCAADPVRRLNELQIGNPQKLMLVAMLRGKSQAHGEQFERAIHSALRRLSIRGEWFEYGPIAWVIKQLRRDMSIDEALQIFRSHFKHQRARRLRRKEREQICPEVTK